MRRTYALAASIAVLACLDSAALAGEPPTITLQPADRALCTGSQCVFTVQAGAVLPTTFLWQHETGPDQWETLPIPGPREGVWTRVSVGVDEVQGVCNLYFGWIGTGDSRRYRCLVSGPFGSTASEPARLTALTADFGTTGGLAEPDYAFDNNDLVVYIDRFFAGAQAADLGSAGGTPGGDGALTNDDFVVFVELFFDGCIEVH